MLHASLLHERGTGSAIRALGLHIHGCSHSVRYLLLRHADSHIGVRARINIPRRESVISEMAYATALLVSIPAISDTDRYDIFLTAACGSTKFAEAVVGATVGSANGHASGRHQIHHVAVVLRAFASRPTFAITAYGSRVAYQFTACRVPE